MSRKRGQSRTDNAVALIIVLIAVLVLWKGVSWLSWKVGHPVKEPGEVYRAYLSRPKRDKRAIELAIQQDATRKLSQIATISDVTCTKVELLDSSDNQHMDGVATLSNGVQRHVKVTFGANDENWMWEFN